MCSGCWEYAVALLLNLLVNIAKVFRIKCWNNAENVHVGNKNIVAKSSTNLLSFGSKYEALLKKK